MLFLIIMQNSNYIPGVLPLDKTLALHNLTILIKSVLNKDQNHYFFNNSLEKGSYQLPKITFKL